MRILCKTCGGCGTVKQNGEAQKTWELLKKHPDGLYAAQVGRLMNCTRMAAANRLAWLENEGLATSSVIGRRRTYVHLNDNWKSR
jgi:hypothetical protein